MKDVTIIVMIMVAALILFIFQAVKSIRDNKDYKDLRPKFKSEYKEDTRLTLYY